MFQVFKLAIVANYSVDGYINVHRIWFLLSVVQEDVEKMSLPSISAEL